MKTFAIILGFLIWFSASYATEFNTINLPTHEKERYINDIPFNTEDVADAVRFELAMDLVFEMEDEEYIDDVPFDTSCVSADCFYKKAMAISFDLPDEETILDVPSAFLML